jgi:hypothetical protein
MIVWKGVSESVPRITSKEESQIRLSETGKWFHQGQPFENGKIIEFFHRAIRKDDQGEYFLYNRVGNKTEHVYFEVADTAYFVMDIGSKPETNLLEGILNSGQQVSIAIESLVEDERGAMYCQVLSNDRARITQPALEKLADMSEMDKAGVFIKILGQKHYLSKNK